MNKKMLLLPAIGAAVVGAITWVTRRKGEDADLEYGGPVHTFKAIDVNVPVQTSYNQWTQFESFPEFMTGVEHVQQKDDKHLHWRAKIAGKVEEFDAEITEQTPDQRIAWRSTSGPKHHGVVTFHYIDPNTSRVAMQLDVQPPGMVEKVGSKLGVMEDQIERDLRRFKDFIESHGVATGAWRGAVR